MTLAQAEEQAAEDAALAQANGESSLRSHISSLFQGSATYIAGDLATKALAFVLIPVYTRYLTPADYGIIEVVKALTTGFGILCVMGLNGAMTRYYFDYPDDLQRRQFLGNISLLLLLVSFSVVFLFDRYGEALSTALFRGIPFNTYIRLAIWTVFVGMASTVMLTVYRTKQEPVKYVALQITQSFVSFGLILCFVVVRQNGALGKIEGEFVGAMAIGLLVTYLVRPHIRPYWSWSEVKRSLKFGVPLVPHLIFWWVIDLSDRMFLQYYATLQEVGIYSLGYNMASLMVVVTAGLNNAWAPYFFSISSRPGAKEIIAKLLTYSLCAFLFIGLVLALFSRELVFLVTTPDYYEAHRIIPLIVIGFVFMGLGILLTNIIFYEQKSHYMPVLTGIAACVNVGLNMLLIPPFGMMGAAYATVVAMAVYACAIFIASQKVYRIPFDTGKIALVGVAFAALIALGTELRLEQAAAAIAVKTLILFAFLVFLWRSRIVCPSDLAIVGRRTSTV
ncbi:MAG: hypothetical protein EWM72_01454 [Nitrospira sp.]|nr:MAG: hypothetical protein EWM72_01454 [Nitrospira sp.]